MGLFYKYDILELYSGNYYGTKRKRKWVMCIVQILEYFKIKALKKQGGEDE